MPSEKFAIRVTRGCSSHLCAFGASQLHFSDPWDNSHMAGMLLATTQWLKPRPCENSMRGLSLQNNGRIVYEWKNNMQ